MKQDISKPIVLFFPFDLLSHYSRCIQLAQSIQDKYQIHFASSRKYNDQVESAGFKHFKCESFDPEIVLEHSRKFKFSWLNYENLKRVFQSQVQSIQEYKPVTVIGDTAPALKMAAELTKTKHVSLMNGYMSKYYALTRNISKDNFVSILQNKLTRNLLGKMTNIGEQVVFRFIQRSFNRLRKENNLPKYKMYLDELEGDFNLICDDLDLFPQTKLPQNYKIIGPLYYQSDLEEPEILQFLDNGKPSLLVNIGSSGELKRFSFLNNEYFKNFNIIFAGEMGKNLNGKNVIQCNFVNSGAILDDIDLVICHGGNGIIYQSLAHGVPLICAASIFEQEWNAQRVQALDLGVSIEYIKNEQQIIEIVKKWITKKGTAKFLEIKNRIDVKRSIQNFKNYWNEVVENNQNIK